MAMAIGEAPNLAGRTYNEVWSDGCSRATLLRLAGALSLFIVRRIRHFEAGARIKDWTIKSERVGEKVNQRQRRLGLTLFLYKHTYKEI